MPRIRTVKPEFWTDGKTGKLSPLAKCLFIGLLNLSDDFGVLLYEPDEWRVKLFPYDYGITTVVLNTAFSEELERENLVVPFSLPVLSGRFVFITNFNRHQVINHPSKPLLRDWKRGETPTHYARRFNFDIVIPSPNFNPPGQGLLGNPTVTLP